VGEEAGAAVSDPLEAAKREQDRTAETLADAKRQLTEAMDDKAGPPAEDPEQAEQQLRSIRGELERDLATLRARVPDTDKLVATARPIALAAGGALATVAVLSRRVAARRRRQRHEQELREQATALAEALARLDLDAIAAEAAAEREQEEGKGRGALVAAALVGVGVVVAAWARARTREEPDIWGPGPGRGYGDLPPATESLTAGHPAQPTDVTDEVPTIPVDER
jgi:hypothetical protein